MAELLSVIPANASPSAGFHHDAHCREMSLPIALEKILSRRRCHSNDTRLTLLPLEALP
jgi:hypothetical protein